MQGTFPNEIRIAQLIPIYKSGNKENLVNYSPIFAVSCFSKIPEKLCITGCIYIWLKTICFIKNSLACKKGHCAYHAIVQLTDQIKACLIKTFFIDLFLDLYLFIDLLYRYVFIDFFKAYDTADHKILLKKLSHYGIKNKSLDWFICYLSNRKQLIGYNVHNKSTLYLECHGDPFLNLYCSCFI